MDVLYYTLQVDTRHSVVHDNWELIMVSIDPAISDGGQPLNVYYKPLVRKTIECCFPKLYIPQGLLLTWINFNRHMDG